MASTHNWELTADFYVKWPVFGEAVGHLIVEATGIEQFERANLKNDGKTVNEWAGDSQ